MNKEHRMKDIEKHAQDLEGDVIKQMFKGAKALAYLHQTISSPRGNYFRRRLLQMLGTELSVSDIEKMRHKAELEESQRHINKLLGSALIEEQKDKIYKRTNKGEESINAIRKLEMELGEEQARKIFNSFLGPNSIRLFLKAYGIKKEIDLVKKEIKFSPEEIGKLSLFLPRSIEGIAAIDKLNNAELLTYKDNGNIYLNPKRARGFYKYLTALYRIITHKES